MLKSTLSVLALVFALSPALAEQTVTIRNEATKADDQAPEAVIKVVPGGQQKLLTAEPTPLPTAPAVTTAAVPAGCKWVVVTRPGVNPVHPEIHLTFRGNGASVAAIRFCNPDDLVKSGTSQVIGVFSSPTAGARVDIRTRNGVGTVGLPTMFEIGDIHQVVCDVKEGDVTFNLYEVHWDGGLPDSLTMQDNTGAITGSPEEHKAMCIKKGLTPDLLAQIKKQ